jgi:hypothetical protein
MVLGMAKSEQTSARRVVGLGAAILIVAAVLIAFLQRERSAPAPEPTAQASAAPPPVLNIPPPALQRADLIAAANRAAAAYAAGQAYSPENAGLVGRRFEVALPFGCEAPGGASLNEPASWRADPERGTVTLTATPQNWTDSAWVMRLAGGGPYEAVEGFWIDRPWLLADGCPAHRNAPAPQPATPTENVPAATTAPAGKTAPSGGAPAAKTPAAPSEGAPVEGAPTQPGVRQTLGLAQFFAPGASRVSQRGDRPYETVLKRSGDGSKPLTGPYRLVLAGRIARHPDGQAIRCDGGSADQRPVCLVAVEFDHVRFERQADGMVLAEWRS